jgi:hypothetical protein
MSSWRGAYLRTETTLHFYRDSKPGRPACSQVTLLTEYSGYLQSVLNLLHGLKSDSTGSVFVTNLVNEISWENCKTRLLEREREEERDGEHFDERSKYRATLHHVVSYLLMYLVT